MNHVIQCDLWRHRYGVWRHHFCSGTDTALPDVTTTVVPAADVINSDRKRRPVSPEVTLTYFLDISGVSEFEFACHPCAGTMLICFIFAFFRGFFWLQTTGVANMWPFVGYVSSLIRRQIQNWQNLDRRRDALGLLSPRHGSAQHCSSSYLPGMGWTAINAAVGPDRSLSIVLWLGWPQRSPEICWWLGCVIFS